MRRCIVAAGAGIALAAALAPVDAGAQVVSQSDLTFEDVDPDFELTLEQVAMDTRWLGVPPREITWSPDGEWIYFRWREDPAPGQEPETDPWYAANRDGTKVRRVSDEEAARIPSGDIVWSADRRAAAWSRGGTLFFWTRDEGTRAVLSSADGPGDLSISADGSHVFFAMRGAGGGGGESGTEARSADLWVYDVAAERLRQVAEVVAAPETYDESEQWLRDQQLELLEIVRDRRHDREVADSVRRARDPDAPQPIPIAEGAAARDIRRSPDGRFLTFQWVKDPGGDHRTYYLEYVNETGAAEPQRARPKVGAPMPEYRMGIVKIDPSVPADSVEVLWVDDGTEKETILHGPYWNPQGTVAVVQILSMDHKDKWISRLDLETGKTTVIHHEHQDEWIGGPLVGGRWQPGYLQWLPDGSAFGFVSEASGWSMLYLGTPDGTVTQLTHGEWEVRGADLSPDGETWYLVTSAEHPGEEHLYHLPARGGELVRITPGEGIHRPVVSPDGERVATTFETPLLMPDLYLLDNEPGAEQRRITKSGTDAYYRYDWAESEIITFPDANGLPTWAEVWEAPETPNHAAVVYAHGCGECAQAVDKGWTGVRSMLYANYLREQGYVAASIDYRGSSGYGHDNRTYAYRQMGISDVDSALPLLDILAERYGVDRRRIGLYGCSYGGFFTLMSLFRHPGAYAAGVAQCSVTDWAHYNQGYTSRILNGAPADDPEAYRRSSPIYYAEGLEDALQIQHGVVDNNVQIQDVFRLAQRLIELEKDFDLMVYPVEAHGWRTDPSRLDSYKRMTRWFARHLLGEVATKAAGTGR
ncbi:MAG TPA: prolyl oligopeptidase family serine peptidase [Longimicrobiales bacterium]